jgi:hypothetical protein
MERADVVCVDTHVLTHATSSMKALANFFRGIHVGLGITPLPDDASPQEERNFVLSRIGIVVLMVGWCVALLYFIGAI